MLHARYRGRVTTDFSGVRVKIQGFRVKGLETMMRETVVPVPQEASSLLSHTEADDGIRTVDTFEDKPYARDPNP